ncbi:MAG: response regulator transcription factor [Candidatus Omnitrophica bacterium]|nr:response regulator transcription factor [Candidatus Omnitrophota bacterium]
MSKPIIYVVDDDVSVCRALSLLLKSHGFEVETFNRAKDFLTFKHFKRASCLVLDVELPDINGFAMQEPMLAQQLFIPIVFITGHGSIPMSVKAMRGGAVDFLAKPFTDKELLAAIDRAIAKNKIQNKEQAELTKIAEFIKTLSPTELEVFRLVASGMANKQIAYKRGIVLQTVKVHRSRVMQKLRAKNVTELIRLAEKAKIIPAQK